MPLTRRSRKRSTALFVLVVVLALISVPLASVPVAADIDTAERSIATPEAEADETVTVEVAIEIADDGEAISIFEDYMREFQSAAVLGLYHNGERIDQEADVLVIDPAEGVAVAYQAPTGFESGDAVTLEYEVTMPEDATADDEFGFTGEVGMDDHDDVPIGGDAVITATDGEQDDNGDQSSEGDRFELSNLDPAEIGGTPDQETIEIEVTVENSGEGPGSGDIELVIVDQATDEIAHSDTIENVELGAGDTTTITFEDVPVGELDVGTYRHEVSSDDDHIGGSLTVEGEEGDSDDGMIGFDVIPALVALLVTARFARRDR